MENFYEGVDMLLIACDHGGFSLKKKLMENFSHISWEDLGCHDETSTDYPHYAQKLVTTLISKKDGAQGVLICNSGQGMAMSANRNSHIRAALCHHVELARLSRQHNNANVLCLGSQFVSFKEACEILKTFLETPFEKGGRHERRVKKMEAIK